MTISRTDPFTKPGDTIVPCPNAPSDSTLRNNMTTAESLGGKYPVNQPINLLDRNFIYDNLWFYNNVATDKPWDYKNQPTHGAHPEYTDFGNFNYGAAGAALGFPPIYLQKMAGLNNQQRHGTGGEGTPGNILDPNDGKAPYGDQPNDNNWIKNGIEYNKQYPVGGKSGPCG
jgi:hypothetical protein